MRKQLHDWDRIAEVETTGQILNIDVDDTEWKSDWGGNDDSWGAGDGWSGATSQPASKTKAQLFPTLTAALPPRVLTASSPRPCSR